MDERDNTKRNESKRKSRDDHVKETRLHDPFLTWGCFVCLGLTIYFFIHVRLLYSFPDVVMKNNLDYDNQFSEERAREHLEAFVGFGPRVAGSHANENLSWKYIIDEVNSIKASALPSQEIILDLQTVSGSFHLENMIKTNYYSVYDGLKNVVVKLTSDRTKEDSLLINCHYDSVANSPGKFVLMSLEFP